MSGVTIPPWAAMLFLLFLLFLSLIIDYADKHCNPLKKKAVTCV